MERDAVSAGVSPIGGLFSTAEVRILICYILSSIKKAVPARELADTLHYEGIANVFEVSDSIVALTESGHIELYDENDDTYLITELGRQTAETLKTSLPFTVKERAYLAAIKMVTSYYKAKESDIKISREGDKTFITCSALDNNEAFMTVKLMVADEEQAIFIKNKFINGTDNIYSEIISLLTK